MAASVPRKQRGSAGPTRAATLRAALQIIDDEGVAGLSMRRLGQALSCDPMSLYRHAPNKDALLDSVAELVLLDLTVDVTDADWPGQLRKLTHQFRKLALAHPNMVPLLITRPLATPLANWPLGALRPLEGVLELLTRAGFSEADALRIYRMVFGSMQGHVLNELQTLVVNDEEPEPLLRLGLHRLPLREFPRIRQLAPVLAAYDGEAELDRRMDIMITGLEMEIHPTTPSDGASET